MIETLRDAILAAVMWGGRSAARLLTANKLHKIAVPIERLFFLSFLQKSI